MPIAGSKAIPVARLACCGKTSPGRDNPPSEDHPGEDERGWRMRAIVNTPGGTAPVELREVPEPKPAPNEALLAVRAFSLNRGELRSFVNNEEGWIPGQDISGVVLKPAANGLGPPAGTRIVGLT